MKKYLSPLAGVLPVFLLLFSTFFYAQIQSVTSGPWNSPTTWGGTVPTDNDEVIINAGHTVSVNSAITRSAATTVNGSFQISPGGFAGGTAFTYEAAATLIFDHGASLYDVFNTAAFWPAIPATSRPRNVIVKTGGGIRLYTNRIISVNLQTAAGIYINPGNALTISGVAQINNGGFFADSPTYGNASTLIYNTTSSYLVGNEWTGGGSNTVTAGLGIPDNIIVQNSTNLKCQRG